MFQSGGAPEYMKYSGTCTTIMALARIPNRPQVRRSPAVVAGT